ncbi:sortase [Patescibacteria group bacterium]
MRLVKLRSKKIINRAGLVAIAAVISLFIISFFPIRFRFKGTLDTNKINNAESYVYKEELLLEHADTSSKEVEDTDGMQIEQDVEEIKKPVDPSHPTGQMNAEQELTGLNLAVPPEAVETIKPSQENKKIEQEDVLFFPNGLPSIVEEDKNVAKNDKVNSENSVNPQNNEKKSVQSVQINKIIIPKINVEMNIIEGDDEKSSLRLGAWLLPMSSSPDIGGNTIIAAHRYLYKPPSPKTFWDLDKLAVGDEFEITWAGEVYSYTVIETKIVEPDDVSILYNTAKPRATLFTCTPIYTSKKRLVVVGKPAGEDT